MSKIKNNGLDQYGAEPFKQQQFETAGTEGINQTLASHNKKKANINGYKICNAITTVISLLCNWFHIKLYGVDLQLSHT